jgi:hypothetical protein
MMSFGVCRLLDNLETESRFGAEKPATAIDLVIFISLMTIWYLHANGFL